MWICTEKITMTWSTALVYYRSLHLRLSFIYSNFEVSLSPLVWNSYFLYSLSNTSPLRDWTGKNFIKSQNDRQITEGKACSAVHLYMILHWHCSCGWTKAEQGLRGCPASPWTTIVPGLWGLLAAREASLAGWVLSRASICSAVSHCLLAAVFKQLSLNYSVNGSPASLSPIQPHSSLLLLSCLC